MAEQNFLTRMLLPAAVLILLSVISAEASEDSKHCYWCGPLAEQVHRSQRAPPCGPTLQEMTCDEGYTHCAVVATSPPYAESRLCVKFYQDECYSLYCNTSKSWRMICPCQGNLCNGQNTERENTAFATLAKIVGKNKRNKRSLMGVKGFFPLTPRTDVVTIKNNITMLANNEATDSMQSDQAMEEKEMLLTTLVINNDIDQHDLENVEENTIEKDSDSEMQGDQPIEEQMEIIEAATEIEDTTKPHDDETIDDDKTLGVAPTIALPQVNKDNDQLTVTTPVQFADETREETTQIATLTSMLPTSIEIELSVVHIKNPKDNMPPPEALQQNVTPAKVSAPTTMETVAISTTNNIEITTHAIKETIKKNIENKNTEKHEADNNGEGQSLIHIWELVLLMNIIIYVIL